MEKPPQSLKVVRVSSRIIQRKFNQSQVPGMIKRGELTLKLIRESEIKDPEKRRYPEPPGTLSQTIQYKDKRGRLILVVHQYKRPDGTLGASGKPDPKRLRIGNIIYIV